MVEQVWNSPAIYRIEVELPQNPLRNLNVYVISTPERNLVIDTGFRRQECRAALWKGIGELGLDLSKTALFLTHLHSDHTGLVGDFVDRGIPVYMGSIDLGYLSGEHQMDHLALLEEMFGREGFPPEELARQATENQGRAYAPTPGFPAIPVSHGDIIPMGSLEVVALHTPGHTPGHMVLYLPREQILFSGDHILFDITPNISVWYQVPHSLQDYLDSLDQIKKLPVRVAFPAHRSANGDLCQRVAALQAHHAQRLREIQRAVGKYPDSTAYALAGEITWSTRGLTWEQFPPNQKWFAMAETLAHLYYLVDRGTILRVERPEGVRYRMKWE